MNDYQRIAKAIDFLSQRVQQQPTLEEVAAQVHLSPFHFQRLFCQWAGISPKRFLQIMTLENAKSLVSEDSSLLETSDRLGLSSTSRLYDHFVALEAVTPGEFKSGGHGLNIDYGLHMTPFGELLVAKTQRGICKAAFTETEGTKAEIEQLHQQWPNAVIVENHMSTTEIARSVSALSSGIKPTGKLSLHISGTNFQVAVWRALLNSGPGDTLSYSAIADSIQKPESVRAVANAVGANPVALLIPCHRVIRKSGALGGFRWGEQRKRVIRFYEQITQHA
ncbi:MAG: methylated-DNA--[protein]-cysteine S-methyltransferase [Pseudohongiella sp.]|nr:methylated-DNA--[protein]-cysteine S-methyltransferase [Pseudohongiella sp.]MDO9519275.1 methylated-DNA--[protein]-cysteine S-methyltransferase [Pseudohongiella sp.]MDP2126114.1 methylated-DNA--[protein]-cysteine S-methyltransferase [Pseudohongiella sp.]